MQIDWDEAPEWAWYVVRDADGLIFWHEHTPTYNESLGEWESAGRFDCVEPKRVTQRPFAISRPVESPATLNALDNDYFL